MNSSPVLLRIARQVTRSPTNRTSLGCSDTRTDSSTLQCVAITAMRCSIIAFCTSIFRATSSSRCSTNIRASRRYMCTVPRNRCACALSCACLNSTSSRMSRFRSSAIRLFMGQKHVHQPAHLGGPIIVASAAPPRHSRKMSFPASAWKTRRGHSSEPSLFSIVFTLSLKVHHNILTPTLQLTLSKHAVFACPTGASKTSGGGTCNGVVTTDYRVSGVYGGVLRQRTRATSEMRSQTRPPHHQEDCPRSRRPRDSSRKGGTQSRCSRSRRRSRRRT